jgi:antitoxin PrlF
MTHRKADLFEIAKSKLISKVTQKYQATIPQAVRKKLESGKGDRIIFEIEDDKVVLKKLSSLDWEYLESVSATLSEWSSDADEKAYSDL